MTTEEIIKLFTMVQMDFPKAFEQANTKEKQLLLAESWRADFKNHSWQEVYEAYRQYKHGMSQYAVDPGRIQAGIYQQLEKSVQLPQPPFEEVWPRILKAARYDPRQAKAEFAKLPENIQKALGGHSRLVEIGRAYEEDLKWIKKSIQKEYSDVLAEEKLMLMDGRISIDTVQKQNTLPMYRDDKIAPGIGFDVKQFEMK